MSETDKSFQEFRKKWLKVRKRMDEQNKIEEEK
jgi:hypothetical protein